METINNATTAVKTAIWGEGEGNTTATGTGNSSGSGSGFGSSLTGGTHTTETHKSMIDDTVTSKEYSGKTESDPMAADAYDPDNKKDTDYKPAGPTSTGGQPQGANLTNQQNTNDHPMSNSNEPNTGFGGGGAQPSVSADPASAQQQNTKHQGAERPTEEPESSTGSGSSGGPSGQSSGGGGMGGGMKLPDSDGQSKSEGTGTKYEKSTGLHADGGDFDATRPGAAREAERLMDESGIHHGVDPKGPGNDTDDKKEKKWYGVDHSGFGGHGSHANSDKRASVSSQGGSSKVDNDDGLTRTTESTTSTHQTHPTDIDDGTGKKGLGQKIKEKLHH